MKLCFPIRFGICCDRFTGVSWNKIEHRVGSICTSSTGRKKRLIGYFVNESKAAKAVDEERKKIVRHQP